MGMMTCGDCKYFYGEECWRYPPKNEWMEFHLEFVTERRMVCIRPDISEDERACGEFKPKLEAVKNGPS